MRTMTLTEFNEELANRVGLSRIDITEETFENEDFSSGKYINIDFSRANFINCNFDGADFSYSSFQDCFMPDTSCINTVFRKVDFKGADMRRCNLTGADISGAYLYAAVLEDAVVKDIIYDSETRYFIMKCPEKGGFVGYKTCFNDRLVTLFIPEDARRTSATMDSCRTDKAFVVSIKSYDGKQDFAEAMSYVDENFIYRKGETIEVKDFNPDRWRDSTTGMHFWMTKEEAMRYMTREKNGEKT
ncbi:MAG: pentapeptide repeat-containing protein [Tissierellia bacterium]|nr:pentapeptide repeat-containing protein [Tissierellia bacterium]